MTTALRAGAATANITPPLGTSLAGSMSDRRAEFIHDELHARCLVVDNGADRVAFAICDTVAIGEEQVAAARHLIHSHTGIPVPSILIAATHTHSGPTPAPLFQSDPDPAYLEFLVTRIADGVRCAAANLQPARIGWGLGHEASVVFNRRFFMKELTTTPFGSATDRVRMNPGFENPDIVKPAGPIDPDVGLLSLQHTDGHPLALLGNYTLHYVGGNPGTHVSADYFGIWAEEVAAMTGAGQRVYRPETGAIPPFVAMLTNGCSGDINNIDVSRRLAQPYPYHQMRKVARIVAAEACKAWQRIDYHDHVPLAVREVNLTLGVRKPGPEVLERARELLAAAGEQLNMPQVYARESLLLADYPDTMSIPVQAMRLGDLAIVALPGEVFVEIGLKIKEQSPFPQTICIELANAYAGYIPTTEAHELGGYETWRARSSYLEVAAADKIIAAGLELLHDLWSA